MIPDQETNHLYLADTLPVKHPDFFKQFEQVLKDLEISCSQLSGTKDIWARDYMPIQFAANQFVQFVYNPDYLQSKKWQKTISDVDSICTALDLKPKKSSIVLDGGNVVRAASKVIMCDKVFKENKHMSEKHLIDELYQLLQVDQIIFIPTHPKDFTGHADGMIHFLNDSTVLINDLSKEKPEFQLRFRLALHNAGLEWIEIPYNPYSNVKYDQANGVYINFLQMANTLILPTFGIIEDDAVVKQFEELFRGHRIATIDSNLIADEGGVLNCITWNIKR
ncbi:hypothetical protein GCM10027443_22760 [Pontibacter brevis]